jgi:hypothetical protein
MTEIYIPLITQPGFTPSGQTTMAYNGRLAGEGFTGATLVVVPPDGVFLKTLRIKGSISAKNIFDITLWRTVKADPLINPMDVLVQAQLNGTGIAFTQSYDLTAVSPKNVVDNSTYNYGFAISTSPTANPVDIAVLGEVALLY